MAKSEHDLGNEIVQLPLFVERSSRTRSLVCELLRDWYRVKQANFKEWIFSEESEHEAYMDFTKRPIPGRIFEERAPLFVLAMTELEVLQGRCRLDERPDRIKMSTLKIT